MVSYEEYRALGRSLNPGRIGAPAGRKSSPHRRRRSVADSRQSIDDPVESGVPALEIGKLYDAVFNRFCRRAETKDKQHPHISITPDGVSTSDYWGYMIPLDERVIPTEGREKRQLSEGELERINEVRDRLQSERRKRYEGKVRVIGTFNNDTNGPYKLVGWPEGME